MFKKHSKLRRIKMCWGCRGLCLGFNEGEGFPQGDFRKEDISSRWQSMSKGMDI